MPPEPLTHSLRLKEIAARWRCRVEFVKAMIRRGELAAFTIQGRVRVSPEAVVAAERGPLAVKPRKPRTRTTIPAEVVKLLDD